VIGGGVAGLTAGYLLADDGHSVTVLEAASRLGGQVHTELVDDFVVEHGAEGFPAASEPVGELCRRLGLGSRVIEQQSRATALWDNGALSALDPTRAADLIGIPTGGPPSRGLGSLRGGMAELVAMLARAGLHPPLQHLAPGTRRIATLTDAAVRSIEYSAGRWVARTVRDDVFTADGLILATPPRVAAELLRSIAPAVAGALGRIALRSSLTASLAVRQEQIGTPLELSGVILRDRSDPALVAATTCSSRFPGRAPPGWHLLRAFFRPELADFGIPDSEWVERALKGLTPVFRLRGSAGRAWVSRWPNALPRPMSDADLAGLELPSSIALAGAAMAGGIEGAVRSALGAVVRLDVGDPRPPLPIASAGLGLSPQ